MSRFSELLYLDDAAVDRLLLGSNGEPPDETALPSSASPERRFKYLWEEVQASEEVVNGDGDADSVWDSAGEGQFCAFTGTLTVPSIVALLSVAQELRNFVELGQQMGAVPISGNEEAHLEKLAALRDLIRESYPVIMRIGGSNLPVILPLDADKSRVTVGRYRGVATVYGRIDARTATGEDEDVIELPGLAPVQQLSRQQRRAAARSGPPQQQQPNDMTIPGPALRLRVLAIQQ